MKVKEVDRTANIAWSPQTQVPIYLAAGTAAQQLDASFSTNSNLEIYGLNLSESGHDMPCLASLPVDQRFHKVVWGGSGMAEGTTPSGIIVGGADRGMLTMYDAAKLIKGEDDAVVFTKDKHTGPVTALDFNPFQANLLASGGSESELYIWDVNKLGTPMTPGAKSQPLDDVRCVAWNRQVQHILASTFSSRCVVWDLRKNDPIIKVSDSTSRMRCKVVAWHPDVATQLCIASEDDNTPVIQIWDLRQASSPLKTLDGHHKGVLSVAWCQADSDLLLSCGKDNRILVWNPNAGPGEIVAELPTSNQWSFDVSWCPRNPAIIASASFDGRVSLHSLMGGQQQVQPNNRVSDSFGPGLAPQLGQAQTPQVTCQLKSPPKWLRRPCGATFGFGGKLVSFETAPGEGGVSSKSSVYISNVVTEPELVEASTKLETSLREGNLAEYVQAKLVGMEGDKAKLWQFIGASFGDNCDQEFLKLLGIDLVELSSQMKEMLQPVKENGNEEEEEDEVTDKVAGLDVSDAKDEFEMIAAQEIAKPLDLDISTALDQKFSLSRDTSTAQGKMTIALLAGDIELAVDLAIAENRFAEALILSIRGGQDLLLKTQARYFQHAANKEIEVGSVALIEAVSMGSWEKLVGHCSLESWKEVLAALVTYTDSNTKQVLAGRLADRLASAGGDEGVNGLLCYMVAGDLEKVVTSWLKVVGQEVTPACLQELVEVVVMSRAAVQTRGLASISLPGGQLSAALAQYASLLAGQGSLATALTYLGEEGVSEDKQLQELKERLEKALVKTVTAAPVSQHQQPLARNASGASVASRGSVSHGSLPGRDSRRQSVEPQFNNFVTGLPPQAQGYTQPASGYGYQQPPASTPAYNPPPPSASQPQYTGFTPAPTNYGAPPQSYAAPAPAADPVPTFQPPPTDQTSPPAPNNPLLRRNRALDPSITSPVQGGQYGYMQPAQPYAEQYSQPTQFMQPQPAPTQPSMFTPDPVPAFNQPSAPGLPPSAGHVPDQPGPGYTPIVSSGSGWNDPPPMIRSRPAPSEPATTTTNSDPITHPIFGSAAPEPAPAPTPGWGGFQPAPVQQFQQPASVQQFQQPAPQGYQGFIPSEPANQPAPQPAALEPTPPAPIPVEHQVIQDTLENLRSKCQQGAAAGHPQVRRKLEDVSLKLDILYDKLRKSVLSPTTLQGLHTILQHIYQYDYQSCMQVISGLISGGSFAEMSDFMPGVKVLLQVAQQQGVYVEFQK